MHGGCGAHDGYTQGTCLSYTGNSEAWVEIDVVLLGVAVESSRLRKVPILYTEHS